MKISQRVIALFDDVDVYTPQEISVKNLTFEVDSDNTLLTGHNGAGK